MIETCEHGMTFSDNSELFEDDLSLAFHSACVCCDMLMHHSAPYQIHTDGRTLCSNCRDKSEPDTFPLESWSQ